MCHWTNGIARAFICLTTYGTTATKFNFGQRQRATMIPSGSSYLDPSCGEIHSNPLSSTLEEELAETQPKMKSIPTHWPMDTNSIPAHWPVDTPAPTWHWIDASGLSSSKNSSGRGRQLANVCTLLLVLGAFGLFSTHYHAEPLLQNLRSRRSSTILPIHHSDDIVDSNISNSRLPSPTTARKRKQLERQGVGCGAYVDEDSCNKSQDKRGNECHWCTDQDSNQLCVADDSLGYSFAPCNNWMCHDMEDPSKSDITACERV